MTDITYNNDTPAVHSFPSTQAKVVKDCSAYNIQNCGVDGVYETFKHTLPGGIKEGSKNDDYLKNGSINLFDQREFITGENSSMDKNGMIYVPHACKEKQCRVHVSLHGCQQGMNFNHGYWLALLGSKYGD